MAEGRGSRTTRLCRDLDQATVCRVATDLRNRLPAGLFVIADTHDGPLWGHIKCFAISVTHNCVRILGHDFINERPHLARKTL